MRWPAIPIRPLLIGLLLLGGLQFMLAVGAFWSENTRRGDGFRLPLPSRMAAIVATVEASPPESRDRVLDAISDADTAFWIVDSPSLDIAGDAAMPRVAAVVERYVEALGNSGPDREVQAWIAVPPGAKSQRIDMQTLRLWSEHHLRLAVSLQTGDWLFVETRDPIAREVYGFPPGLWAGMFGLAVAAFALLALWRGLSPLTDLARKLETFPNDPANPIDVHERGLLETRNIIGAANRMQRALSDLMTEREAMFGTMSHDLRTYLTRLKLRVGSLPDGAQSDKWEADLDHMEAIVEGGLLQARLGAGQLEVQDIHLADFVERVVAETAGHIRTDISCHPVIKAEAHLLRRTLDNLISNALRHGGPHVTVKLECGSDRATLAVLDQGLGVADDRLVEISRPFATTRRGEGGEGLGLHFVKTVAEAHGWTLHLGNRPGGGFAARLSMPIR